MGCLEKSFLRKQLRPPFMGGLKKSLENFVRDFIFYKSRVQN